MYFNRLISCFTALVFAVVASAQSVTNVDANQEGKTIVVTYDLLEKANINLYVTQDGGKTKILIPRSFLGGDVGNKISPGTNKRILWRVLEQYPNENFQGENMSFIVQAKPIMRFFALFNMGYSFDSGMNVGASIGQLGQIGWYAKAVTSLSFPKSADFECDEGGKIDGVLPAYSGVASNYKAYGVAGVVFRVAAPVYLNAGIGYGSRVCDWEITDGRWAKNVARSYSGLAIDAGILARLNSIIFSAGVTLVKGSVDIGLGVGYLF